MAPASIAGVSRLTLLPSQLSALLLMIPDLGTLFTEHDKSHSSSYYMDRVRSIHVDREIRQSNRSLSLSLSLSYTGKVWPSLRVVIISGEACDSSLASR